MRSRRRLPAIDLASEAGFAVPTVTLMIVAALAMAGVAVSTSIGGQGGIVRDQGAKTALAVAESGVDQALLQFNRHGFVSSSSGCEPIAAGEPDAEGWCGPVSGIDVNGGEVTYYARPQSTELAGGEIAWTDVEVVSTGTLDGVTRRIEVSASSAAGQEIFFNAAVQAKDDIVLDSFAQIHAGTATNGNLVVASNASQCGTATVGIGKELIGGGEYSTDIECGVPGGEPGEDEIDLPPVEQGEVPEENDNGRLFNQDRISGNKTTACFDGFNGKNKEDESCGERELVVGSNSAVTLGGEVYSFCKVTLESNSSLYAAPGANVKIFFDSPEACGYAEEEEPVTQLVLRSNSRITTSDAEAQGPEPKEAGSMELYFVGSNEIDTKILLNSETAVDGPCEQNFVIYAPRTDIELSSETKFCGGMAGKSVHLDSNAEVWTSEAINEFVLPNTPPHYVVHRFVECTATLVSGDPDEGC